MMISNEKIAELVYSYTRKVAGVDVQPTTRFEDVGVDPRVVMTEVENLYLWNDSEEEIKSLPVATVGELINYMTNSIEVGKIFTLDETKEAYQKALDELKSRGSVLSVYQDGKIVENLFKDGHDSDSIKQAVSELSPIANQPGKFSMGYANNLVDKSRAVLEAVIEINNLDINLQVDKSAKLQDKLDALLKAPGLPKGYGDPTSIPHLEYANAEYRIYAKDLMNNGQSLNSEFDIKIAGKMLRAGYPADITQRAIIAASPVAQQPIRNPERYAKYAVDKALDLQKKREKRLEEIDANYDKAARSYVDKVQAIQAANPEREYTSYWDGRVVADMFREGTARENIQKAVKELSPLAASLQEEKKVSPERYANRIVYQVLQSIERQHAAQYKDVTGIEERLKSDPTLVSATEAYQYSLKSYIDKEAIPNAFVDTQIAKGMLTQEYSQEEIQKALIEASPVAIEPGRTPERYANSIAEQAVEQLKKQQQILQERQLKEQAAPSVEAVHETQLSNDSPNGVKAPINEIQKPGVANESPEYLHRLEAIQQQTAKPHSLTERYRSEFKRIVGDNPSKNLIQNADKAVATALLSSNEYNSSKIQETIQKNSPEAVKSKTYASDLIKSIKTPAFKKEMEQNQEMVR